MVTRFFGDLVLNEISHLIPRLTPFTSKLKDGKERKSPLENGPQIDETLKRSSITFPPFGSLTAQEWKEYERYNGGRVGAFAPGGAEAVRLGCTRKLAVKVSLLRPPFKTILFLPTCLAFR